MKTATLWLGALLFGFVGGIVGQRFGSLQTMPADLKSFTRGHKFELLDPSGRVVSVWTTDAWGRPYLGFSDAKWEGRIVIGPIDQEDAITKEEPDADSWGIRVEAPGHVAHAALGTVRDPNTQKQTGFANWR